MKLNVVQRLVIAVGGLALGCLLLTPAVVTVLPEAHSQFSKVSWRIEYWPPFICLCLAVAVVVITLALVVKSNPPGSR